MDPYQPPKAGIADPMRGPGSAFKAVTLGLLVDIGGTLLSGVLMSLLYSMYLASTGLPIDQLQEQLQSDFHQGWLFGIASAIGCSLSVLGGYACARIARRDDLTLPIVMAAISAGLGLLLGWSTYSAIEMLSLGALTVACIFFGYRLGMRRVARVQQRPS